MSVAFSHKNSPDQNIHQSNAWYFSSQIDIWHEKHSLWFSICPDQSHDNAVLTLLTLIVRDIMKQLKQLMISTPI